MIDTAQIKERTDLLTLVCQHVQLRKVSGSEYAGPCPKCGGDDRFHLDSEKGWWFCRQCHPQRSDVIGYVQWLHGVAFREACTMLGADPAELATRAKPKPVLRPTLPTAENPGDAWQSAAEHFVEYAEKKLWQSPDALAYLVGRGLSHETIKAARLGYNSKNLFADSWQWGFDDHRRVWLPAGWTIPCWMDGHLQYVKVRRPEAELCAAQQWNAAHPKRKPRPVDKYIAIKGSKKRGVLYGLNDLPICQDLILCEGEYDALLLRQELGSIAAVVATGAASATPGIEALRHVLLFRRFWAALDIDNAGQGGADHWAELSGRVRRLPPPDHDVTDAWKAGHDLMRWAVGGIGPQDSERRKAWLHDRLAEYQDIVFDVEVEDTDLAQRRWQALHDELVQIEGEEALELPSKTSSVRVSAAIPYTDVPSEEPETCKSVPAEDGTMKTIDYSVLLAQRCGGEWHEIAAPQLEGSMTWCADRHCFFENDQGEIVSMPKH